MAPYAVFLIRIGFSIYRSDPDQASNAIPDPKGQFNADQLLVTDQAFSHKMLNLYCTLKNYFRGDDGLYNKPT
jgi:hypothetical protein